MVKKLLERFIKNNSKRQTKYKSGWKTAIKREGINYMLNGKVMIISLIAG